MYASPPAARRSSGAPLRTLLRQRIRRDRVQLPLWILGTAALAGAAVSGAASSYGTEQERTELLATVMANPVILMFRGLPSGAGEEEFTLFLILPFLAMMAAFMSVFLAVRHTRGDEEQGRSELLAATSAARLRPLVATIVHGLAANIVLGALTAAVFTGSGFPLAGSVVSGTATAGVGVCLLGVAFTAGQLMRTSRGANSLAVWVLMAAFVIAGLGNAIGTPDATLTRMESSGLAWISPFGWAENSRPFADDAIGLALLPAALGLFLVAFSLVLQSTRDLGEGLVPERAGRVHAGPGLSSPLGLVWRLTGGATLGWAVGGFLTGLLATSLASVISSIGSQLPSVQRIFEAMAKDGNLEQGMVVIFYTIVGVLAACAAVQTISRARQEEAHGTAEALLATAVARVRWLAGYLAVALIAVVATAGMAILGSLLGVVGRGEAWSLVQDALVAGLGQALAAGVFLAVAALLFVLMPRGAVALSWALVLVALMLGLFGPLLGAAEEVTSLSPFAQAPLLSGDGVDVKGLWWLLAVAVIGSGGALMLMRCRELHPAG
ncbi:MULTISPECIES: ABC transporter permease [Bacteria]|uniref:ABC transporter permease n=1 Tax=Bacteria TaxID=2 RepID=UPI003C79FA3B